jgi:hypothetical protein
MLEVYVDREKFQMSRNCAYRLWPLGYWLSRKFAWPGQGSLRTLFSSLSQVVELGAALPSPNSSLVEPSVLIGLLFAIFAFFFVRARPRRLSSSPSSRPSQAPSTRPSLLSFLAVLGPFVILIFNSFPLERSAFIALVLA